jgi:hypothetical protein
MDRRLCLGCEGCANIDADLAFADGEHLSCELLPIAIKQCNLFSRAGPEHAAQMLGDFAL